MQTDTSPLSLNLDQIQKAADRLNDVIIRSPLVPYLIDGRDIRLKAENLQPTGSFKIRGSTNAIRALDPAELEKGVYTASAGNFGQGLSRAARDAGIPARVFVPENAAQIKIEALKALGATVITKSPEEWWAIMMARRAQGERGKFMHPCADPAVIAGNATIGMEIIEDWPDVETILVPFGGGGLALGIAMGAKLLKPGVRVLACESEAATPLARAFEEGAPVTVPFETSTFITGIGSSSVLPELWPALQHWIDGTLRTTVLAARHAVKSIAMDCHMVAEGAGAVPLACALHTPDLGRVVSVVSGGNIDAASLADILAT